MKKSIGIFLFLTLLLAGCAKIVTPVGGPKDTTPPKIVKESPANHSTKFDNKNIKITFDEFVVLNNPNQTVIVSPPLKENPELSISGKSVIIKLPDSLRSNTTYSIALSETIKDFTEGNPLPIYTYVFSTGSHIDSFMLSGTLKDAVSLGMTKNASVLLYEQDVDSLPLSARPTYLTKTNSNGKFTFNNIKPGSYKIFALNDINNNLIYDLPTESIAFLSSPVESWCKPATDTLNENRKKDRNQQTSDDEHEIKLALFTERDSNQVLSKYINTTENVYVFPYKTDFKSFSARHLGGQKLDYFQFFSNSQDSVYWYLKETLTDTAHYEFTVDGHRLDTVKITPFRKNKGVGSRRRTNEKNTLSVSLSNKENIFQPLTLHFSYPVKPGQFDIIIYKALKSGSDTIVKTVQIPDSFVKSLPIDYKFEEKLPYRVFIRDSVIWGYNGLTNDSVNVRFTTKTEKDYGNLLINYSIEDPNCQYIVSLQNNKGTTIQQNIISTNQSISYEHLDPGSYKIKVIKDRNSNGRWDTGNYELKIQPEEIFFFDKSITIRGYWDIEEDFELK
ncbi:MAG: Ig-like domain-containing protein [Bacteroidales bacterium]|nr:Ig-like domain-containing protein [Bacteroidales bacterium]